MLGCFITLVFLLIAIIIIFAIVAFPVALLVGRGSFNMGASMAFNSPYYYWGNTVDCYYFV